MQHHFWDIWGLLQQTMGDQDWDWHFIVGIGYAKMMDPMTYDSGYLITLVKSWDASTNIFILPIGKCTITLEDVYRIFHILIKGKLMIGLGENTG